MHTPLLLILIKKQAMIDLGLKKTGSLNLDLNGSIGKGIVNRTSLNRFFELSLGVVCKAVIVIRQIISNSTNLIIKLYFQHGRAKTAAN